MQQAEGSSFLSEKKNSHFFYFLTKIQIIFSDEKLDQHKDLAIQIK
jgi:hypothetical protein